MGAAATGCAAGSGVKIAVTLAMGIVALMLTPRVHGQSLWLAGASASGLSDYSYLGMLMPLGHSTLGHGWVMRQWLDRVSYRYDGFVPDIHAVAYGYAPAIGYQWPLAASMNHAALYAGVRVAYTHLDPYDASNIDRGTHVRVSLQGQLTSAVGSYAENRFLAQGQIGNGAYFIRDRFMWRVLGHYTVGPEGVAQGSREYHAFSEGLCFGGIALSRSLSVLLHADAYEQRGQGMVGTFGVEFMGLF